MNCDFRTLQDHHLDVLREIGTIGAGNAATALSQMMAQKVRMTVPEISILPFGQVADTMGGADRLVVGVFTEVKGDAPCNMLLVLPLESAFALADILFNKPVGSTGVLDEMASSALVEVVNVIGGAYLNAISFFTKLQLVPSVPLMAIDMAGAVLNTVLYNIGMECDDALLLDTEFTDCALADRDVKVNYFLFPEHGSLQKIFAAVGVEW